uniref:Uncharacterized protein n=1 Tax=Setaria italica TaxID=4555 RepID=K3Z1L8_SETIT
MSSTGNHLGDYKLLCPQTGNFTCQYSYFLCLMNTQVQFFV